MSRAYYNEIDPFAVQWLRNLIKDGHIADGDVDERSIEDVVPNDLMEYTQCHFFAGIGGWSLACRIAGWPDSRPVWTASTPCQPFSAAGKGEGFADDRDMWPSYEWLVRTLKPPCLFGEQVVGTGGRLWLDRAISDLQNIDYSCGACVAAANTVRAKHQRKRLFYVADAEWNQQSREEPCDGSIGRVGRLKQPVSWDRDWESALREFRTVDDGLSYGVEAVDAPRNAIVPQVAAEFIASYMEITRPFSGQGVDGAP